MIDTEDEIADEGSDEGRVSFRPPDTDAQIGELLKQVQALQAKVKPVDTEAKLKQMEHDRARALYEANALRKERDQAAADLQKLRADVAWTMERLRIKDLFRMSTFEIPAAAEGWLPLDRDPEDTVRIEWLNKHARSGIGDDHWIISLPHRLTLQESMPEVYNVRHIIDLCRGITVVPKTDEEANNPVCNRGSEDRLTT